jgi:hypothetical protein
MPARTLLGSGGPSPRSVKPRTGAADAIDVAETTAPGARCPRCSAAVRPGAPWCTQCYAPAAAGEGGRPATSPAAPGAPRTPAAATSQEAPAPAAVLVAELPAGSWPCAACQVPNDLAVAACQGCGTPFLAGERAARPTVVLPVVGDLLALSPVRRVGLAVGAVVAFVVITALLALLLA